jgi:hypothetical protein
LSKHRPIFRLFAAPHLCHAPGIAARGRHLDRFSFFFAFYGLILGLAVTELLGGLVGIVRARALGKLEAQTALLALLVFCTICTTWIDAWNSLRSVELDFAGLWAPVMIATSYYLAAGVVFPDDRAEFDHLAAYYADRKRFVAAMLFLAQSLVNVPFLGRYTMFFYRQPAVLWLWIVPYTVAICGGLVVLALVRGRRANLVVLVVLILLMLVPYWSLFSPRQWIEQQWGYPPID